MKPALLAVLFSLVPASAHRLDEYLQGTIISIGKDQIQAQLTLTPGTAVLPALLSQIDSDKDGRISPAEQQAYANRVLGDLSLKIDGRRMTLRIRSLQFPAMDDMKEGRGEIHLDLTTDLPSGQRTRNLTFENFHEPRISVYQVNTLVPSDPDIRIEKQDRNYTQSHYQLDYEQNSNLPFAAKLTAWLLASAAFLRLTWLWVTSQSRRSAAPQTDHLAPS